MDTGLRVDVVNVPVTLGERKNIQAWRRGKLSAVDLEAFLQRHLVDAAGDPLPWDAALVVIDALTMPEIAALFNQATRELQQTARELRTLNRRGRKELKRLTRRRRKELKRS